MHNSIPAAPAAVDRRMNWRKAFLLASGGSILLLLFIENVSVRAKLRESMHSGRSILQRNVFSLGGGDASEDDYYAQSPAEEKQITQGETGLPTPSPTARSEGPKPRIKICTIALNPRQGSLFRTNYLATFGSGKYRYVVKQDCPWHERRVRLISYVKCCQSLFKVTRTVNAAVNDFDVVIVTGDEYCYTTDAKPQFRQYYGTSVISTARNITELSTPYQTSAEMMDSEGIRYPLYIPLGPREEFLEKRINKQRDILPPAQREYLYNFLGSLTSRSRYALKRVVATDLATPEKQVLYPSFIHITDKWHLTVTKSNGYVEPDEYKRVLLNSVFTLCPTGHNPEAYRIYEALEAGSIPILGIDAYYERARCNDAFKPFKDANAPFVYLEGGWRQLESFLSNQGKNATWIQERHQMCMDWYAKWMTKTALRFEAILEHRFAKRMLREETNTELTTEEDEESQTAELEAIQEEEKRNQRGTDNAFHLDENENNIIGTIGSL